jgi:hypothetical protein
VGDTNKKMKELELKIYNSCMSWLEEEGPSIMPVYQFQQEPEIVERDMWDHYSELPNPSWYAYKNVEEEKKYPDNVVYNNDSNTFDANIKEYPTTVGSQKFEPILGEQYHLYENNNSTLFLSLIEPNQWDKVYIGTFVLLNNGKWDKV